MKHILYRKNDSILVLKKSKVQEVLGLSFMLIFFCLWYGILFNTKFESHPSLIWIFYLVPLFSINEIIRMFKVLITGEIFEFDKNNSEIRLNNTMLIKFNDIDRVQIRTFYDADGPDSYNLSLVKNDQNKIRLDQTEKKEQISNWADDIAEIIGVNVTWKK